MTRARFDEEYQAWLAELRRKQVNELIRALCEALRPPVASAVGVHTAEGEPDPADVTHARLTSG